MLSSPIFMCKSKRRTAALTTDSIISLSAAATPSVRDGSPSAVSSAARDSTDFEFTATSSTSTQAALLTIKQTLATAVAAVGDGGVQIFISDVRSATDNFRAQRHSASSWRCTIRGQPVVVFQRSLRRPITQPEFIRRLTMIQKSHHSSIANLVGATTSGGHVYLVYRHVAGANLSDCLRNPKNPNFTVLSSWITRMQIADDLAQGFDYIHNFTGADISFVHNYIKSSGVMVTETSLNAKICHFGTAALCGEIPEEKQNSGEIWKEDRIIGAKGYMSPEFQVTGVGTQRTDVYAFGVVALELISGKEAVSYVVDENTGGYYRESVVDGAMEAMVGGGRSLRRWVDRRLRDSYPVEVAEAMTLLALECVDRDPDKRPDMGRVAGRVSKLFMESRNWADQFCFPSDLSITTAMQPR